MQLTFNKESISAESTSSETCSSLVDLRCGQSAVLESLEVEAELGRRLMELGFFPGGDVVAAGCAPGGDPRVYQVDGSEIALRVETARFLKIRTSSIRTLPPAAGRSSRS